MTKPHIAVKISSCGIESADWQSVASASSWLRSGTSLGVCFVVHSDTDLDPCFPGGTNR